jgi:hypothetical protein
MGTRETLMKTTLIACGLMCGLAATAVSAVEVTRATIDRPATTYVVPGSNSTAYPAGTPYLADTYVAPAPADVVIVDVAPPAPRVEDMPAARDGYVWASGYWTWNGSSYEWVPGRYVPALAGYRYVAPRWESLDGGYVMRGEQWVPDRTPNPLGNSTVNPLRPSPGGQ